MVKKMKKSKMFNFKDEQTRHWFIVTMVSIFSFVVILVTFLYTNRATETIWFGGGAGEEVIKTEKKPVGYSLLTGKGVYEASEAIPQVLGIAIDNHWQALPQTGINAAEIIYEVPVEGNITRLLAIFSASSTVSKVGPVRSARPYFLDWLAEYGDPLFMHCGGSPEALTILKTGRVFDINEFYWGEYFSRDYFRIAPHNLYTDSENWQEIFSAYGYKHDSNTWQGWKFDEVVPAGEEVREISVNYTYGFTSGWKYDVENNIFKKTFNNEDSLDSEGQNIVADNVVVQYVGIKVLDNEGRLKIYDIGDGEALILRDGILVRGNWKKENQSDRTRFYSESDEEIPLKPGRTWVMVVPDYIVAQLSS